MKENTDKTTIDLHYDLKSIIITANSAQQFLLIDGKGNHIGLIWNYDNDSEANAAFIVTACNNYDKLIEALKNVMSELNCYDWSKETKPVYDNAQKLLNTIQKETL